MSVFLSTAPSAPGVSGAASARARPSRQALSQTSASPSAPCAMQSVARSPTAFHRLSSLLPPVFAWRHAATRISAGGSVFSAALHDVHDVLRGVLAAGEAIRDDDVIGLRLDVGDDVLAKLAEHATSRSRRARRPRPRLARRGADRTRAAVGRRRRHSARRFQRSATKRVVSARAAASTMIEVDLLDAKRQRAAIIVGRDPDARRRNRSTSAR